MYCSDCLFFGIANFGEGAVFCCKAHGCLPQPCFDADENQKCIYHLTIEVAKIQASARNFVFDKLGDPVEFSKKFIVVCSSDDMKSAISKNIEGHENA